MSCPYIGGVEGGASHSHAVLISQEGKVLATAQGPPTNHYQTGMKECWLRINTLINECKTKASVPLETPLLALGLGLSGCESENTCEELRSGLKEYHPNLAENIVVGSDTDGSLATISNCGGVVCIAGTGSNTLLVNPNGKKFQCGGWGHILADEGSAFKISITAVKICFDHTDGRKESSYSIEPVWELIKQHFKICSKEYILDHIYKNFDKSSIASLCKKLADLARVQNDCLAKSIFTQAGEDLAKSINAVVRHAESELTSVEGGIHIVCVGSVWLSWDLLKAGFVNWMKKHSETDKLTLVRLKTEMGTGAAFMAADKLKISLERDYSKNYTVLFQYDREDCLYTD